MSGVAGLTIREAAAVMGVDQKTVRRRVKDGTLKAKLVNSTYGQTYIIPELPAEYRAKLEPPITLTELRAEVDGVLDKWTRLARELAKAEPGARAAAPVRRTRGRMERHELAKELVKHSPGITVTQLIRAVRDKSGRAIRWADAARIIKSKGV